MPDHKGPSGLPLIWSQRLATSNMATAVLEATIFFCPPHDRRPAIRNPIDEPRIRQYLAFLWACSTAAQKGPDLTDPQHLSEKAGMSRTWWVVPDCEMGIYLGDGGCV
ncbi:hypothetical protein LZ30DRAFT_809981 [Colletotrichum cereale]|nr:hypothetical protein LZ30DRAFT_809981 [Colletotrichum cereale]